MKEDKKVEIKEYFTNFFIRHHRKYKDPGEWRAKVIDELTELFYAATTKQPRQTPYPTEEEVQTFFKELGAIRDLANEFFEYYGTVGWVMGQGKGKPIKNWKLAARRWVRKNPQTETSNIPESLKRFVKK